MIDLSDTVTAKSDQLNAIDLVGGPLTITVHDIRKIEGDQPYAIDYGIAGKSYKPCKSMRRMLMKAWGKDGSLYIGRKMTLYRDPDAKWAGKPVGGIRISHLSHITAPVKLVLPISQGKFGSFSIQPLVEVAPTINDIAALLTPAAVAYLHSLGWLKQGEDAASLAQEHIARIASNPTGFTAQVSASQQTGE